jgi:protein O-mannosyl-transferase
MPDADRKPDSGWSSLLLRPEPAVLFLLPALLAVLVTLPALHGEMVWDDPMLIVHDPFVRSLANLPAAFLRTFWASQPATGMTFDYYRPLTTISYMLTYAVAGTNSLAYHVGNTLVYALTAGLLALVVAEVGAGASVGLAAGLVFAAWPTHAESADFISGRTDLLAGLFMLLALAMYIRHWRGRGHPAWNLLGVAVASAAAALSKEVAYATPAALLLF